MFVKLLLASIVFLGIAAAGMGVKMLLRSGGRFPETHVGRNPALKKMGITCAKQTDTGCHSTEGFPGCAGCNPSSV
jgi:hypothetical protein